MFTKFLFLKTIFFFKFAFFITSACQPTVPSTINEQELVKKAQEVWQAQKSEENWIRGLNLQDIQTKFRQGLL